MIKFDNITVKTFKDEKINNDFKLSLVKKLKFKDQNMTQLT